VNRHGLLSTGAQRGILRHHDQKKVRQQGKREGKTLLPQECGFKVLFHRSNGFWMEQHIYITPFPAKIKPFREKSTQKCGIPFP